MPKKESQSIPAASDSHLEQLAALQAVDEGNLTSFQKSVRAGLLGARALKGIRIRHIQEMAAAGYCAEQIRLAFVAPDSLLNVLVTGFTGQGGVKAFYGEITDAIETQENLSKDERRELFVVSQQRLLDACWRLLKNVKAEHGRALIELMDRLQREIAHAQGVYDPKPGRPPGQPPGRKEIKVEAAQASAREAMEEVAQGDSTKEDANWGEEFVPDDDPEDSVPPEE